MPQQVLKLVAKLVIVITAWGRSLVPVVWTQIRPNATIVGVRQLGSHRRRNSSELHQWWCCRDRKLPEACPAFVSTFCQFLNKSLAMECRERRLFETDVLPLHTLSPFQACAFLKKQDQDIQEDDPQETRPSRAQGLLPSRIIITDTRLT